MSSCRHVHVDLLLRSSASMSSKIRSFRSKKRVGILLTTKIPDQNDEYNHRQAQAWILRLRPAIADAQHGGDGGPPPGRWPAASRIGIWVRHRQDCACGHFHDRRRRCCCCCCFCVWHPYKWSPLRRRQHCDGRSCHRYASTDRPPGRGRWCQFRVLVLDPVLFLPCPIPT